MRTALATGAAAVAAAAVIGGGAWAATSIDGAPTAADATITPTPTLTSQTSDPATPEPTPTPADSPTPEPTPTETTPAATATVTVTVTATPTETSAQLAPSPTPTPAPLDHAAVTAVACTWGYADVASVTGFEFNHYWTDQAGRTVTDHTIVTWENGQDWKVVHLNPLKKGRVPLAEGATDQLLIHRDAPGSKFEFTVPAPFADEYAWDDGGQFATACG